MLFVMVNKIQQRANSLEVFEQWVQSDSIKSLLIIGAPFTGKTFFIKQLEDDPKVSAVHYFSWIHPESLEPATLLFNLTNQLTEMFPDLIIPKFKATTLLTAQSQVIENFLIKPLHALTPATSNHVIILDGIESELLPIFLQMTTKFPRWLKVAATSRLLPDRDQRRLEKHCFLCELDQNCDELKEFISNRLPEIKPDLVLQACQGSWFYVDHYSFVVRSNLLNFPSTSQTTNDILCVTDSPTTLPYGHHGLLSAIESVMPPNLNFYLQLITSSRQPPLRQRLHALIRKLTSKSIESIEKDLIDIEPILDSTDPLITKGAWKQCFRYNCSMGHGIWAEGIRLIGCDTVQDVVEFAYHLAHSKGWNQVNKADILSCYGADLLELNCPVIDFETNELLLMAGAKMNTNLHQHDFVYGCSISDDELVGRLIDVVSDDEAAHGLITAASRGHARICEVILKNRSNVACYVDAHHWNAFRCAACNNNLEIIDLLAEYGVNVDECGEAGRTALRAAAWSGQSNIVLRLLEYNADVNRQDIEGRSALMASSYKSHSDIVAILLEASADPNLEDVSGATALHLALSNASNSKEQTDTIHELLQNGADVNITDKNGWNCIHLAAFNGNSNLGSIVQKCLNMDAQESEGRSALMLAAAQGNLQSCWVLIENGADLDFIDNEGRTALIYATIQDHLEVAKLLLDRGADEAHKDNDGTVALHFAVTHTDFDLCAALATYTTVRISDGNGNHPLIIAAQRSTVEAMTSAIELCIQIVQLLLDIGAPINLQSHDGQSALRAAALASNELVVRCLVNKLLTLADETSLDQCNLDGTPLLHSLIAAQNSEIVSLLLSLGTPISTKDAYGRSCTHIAAQVNNVKIGEILKRYRGNFEAQDEAGRTPLMTAVWASKYDFAYFLLEHAGVLPNQSDVEGATALNIAAHNGERELVILLLKFGAEPLRADKRGRTAADVAQLSGHESIKLMLKNAQGSAGSSGFGSLPTSPSDPSILYYQKSSEARACAANFIEKKMKCQFFT